MSAEGHGGVPRHPNDVTLRWLTARLREAGALPSGSVTSIAVDLAEKWNVAQTARLAVAYDRDAPRDAPRRLFAKIAELDDPLSDVFHGEVAFYATSPSGRLPIPACFGAFFDQRSRASCLLLEDLSDTHVQTPWPLPPSLPLCEAAVRALARLHAYWWSGEEPGTGPSRAAMAAEERRLAAHFAALLPDFFDDLDDRLPPERREVMSRVLRRLPQLKGKRLSGGQAVTRTHGDPHLWNVMFPKDPDRHGCVFVDWEDWRHDMGAADLAYMIALHWYPDRRARYERPLLHAYHEALHQEISTGYGWEELLADYRLGHLQNVFVLIFQQQAGISPGVWWSHLERWFLSFEDLNCGALL